MLTKWFAPKGLYYAWLIMMIGLIIPVRPQLGLFNGIISIHPEDTVQSIIRPLVSAPDARTGQTTPPFAASSEVPVWQVVTAIWLAGVIVFLAHHCVKHYRFMAMAKRWREPVADKDVLLLFQTIKAELGISAKIDIYQCLSVGSPIDADGTANLLAIRDDSGALTGIEVIISEAAQEYWFAFFAEETTDGYNVNRFNHGVSKYGQYLLYGITVDLSVVRNASNEIVQIVSVENAQDYFTQATEYDQNAISGLDVKVAERIEVLYPEQ